MSVETTMQMSGIVGSAVAKLAQSQSLSNVGPFKQMDLSFGSWLNVLTGDNGLGKSFFLDLIWFAMTRE